MISVVIFLLVIIAITMRLILCATRGGGASYITQDKAIALAKEKDASLIFLYVVVLQFLDMIEPQSLWMSKTKSTIWLRNVQN